MKGPVIRSGGQSGVDRAALDAAIAMGRPYGGWCPKGGWAEDFRAPPGLLPFYPHLRETPTARPEERSEWNVRDAAATLIILPGSELQSPGTDFTVLCAERLGKPCHLIRLSDEQAAKTIKAVLISLDETQSLNIAGPRESECLGIYASSRAIFIDAFR